MDKSVEDIEKKSQELDEESRKLDDKYKSLIGLPTKAQALKDAVKTYEINLKNKNDPLIQLQTTRQAIEHYFNECYLKNNKNFKFYESLKVTFVKEVSHNAKNDDDVEVEIDIIGGKHHVKRKTAYFNSQAQTVLNIIDLNKQKWLKNRF